MQEAILTAKDLQLTIGEREILCGVDLSAVRGEFIGIIGPNGAGKSTLLKCLRGMIRPAHGEIEISGISVKDAPDREMARKIAYMQQEINTGFGFTAEQVVLAGRYPYLSWWQNERASDYAIVKKYMTFTGVDHLAEQDVARMSGGKKQRVLLAKVLAQETELILLDEPTASLDLTYQEDIFRLCKSLCEAGKTILVVVHDIRLAAKFCSRLVLLHQGRVLADGRPEDVVTADNLYKAYGMHSAVFHNRLSGMLDLYTYQERRIVHPDKAVHVIAGGGVAAEVVRALYEHKYQLSAGVLSTGDADYVTVRAFGAEVIDKASFVPITAQSAARNDAFIRRADFTVLCNIVYGEHNLANLTAAFAARQLIILEDTPLAARDYTEGEASRMYGELIKRDGVRVMTTRKFIKMMEVLDGREEDKDAVAFVDGSM